MNDKQPLLYTCMRSVGVTDDINKILSYILNAYVTHPSGVNATCSELEISLQKTFAIIGTTNLETLKQAVKKDITILVQRYYPDSNINLEVDIVDNPDIYSKDDLTKFIKIHLSIIYNNEIFEADVEHILQNIDT